MYFNMLHKICPIKRIIAIIKIGYDVPLYVPHHTQLIDYQ